MFKHRKPHAERASTFYGDLQQEILAHLRRGRSLTAGGPEVALDLMVLPLDSLTGVDVVEIESHSSGDLMAAMRQHPGSLLFKAMVPY